MSKIFFKKFFTVIKNISFFQNINDLSFYHIWFKKITFSVYFHFTLPYISKLLNFWHFLINIKTKIWKKCILRANTLRDKITFKSIVFSSHKNLYWLEIFNSIYFECKNLKISYKIILYIEEVWVQLEICWSFLVFRKI